MVVDIFVIGLGTFMVCFYCIHVMKDWGIIKEKEIPENKK